MAQPKLVVHARPVCSFNADWLKPTVDQYLQFEPWDSQRQYPRGTLFYMNCLDFDSSRALKSVSDLSDQGFKVIVDNLWEVNPGPIPCTHRVTCDRWFWYNESLHLTWLGYDRYQPCSDYTHLSLMPMNRRKPHRTELLQHMPDSLLDRMIWSYVAQGRQLPNDGDMSEWSTQRYMNPDWYNTTYLSTVVESVVRPGSRYTPIFITEKTTKPLAYQHPFVVYGNRGTLRTLRSWGFETFDNLWDESYDEIVDYQQRLHAVIDLLNTIQPRPHDAETQKRLQHNRDLFFDTDLVRRQVIKEILEPIVAYAETQ